MDDPYGYYKRGTTAGRRPNPYASVTSSQRFASADAPDVLGPNGRKQRRSAIAASEATRSVLQEERKAMRDEKRDLDALSDDDGDEAAEEEESVPPPRAKKARSSSRSSKNRRAVPRAS